ncbi:MAG: methyl-accepting chemotaxis protein [Comamonadaceae bacterium]|nr:MAG: methyl-accepting chemotaxis protein [Comamonadaceae bacterium]
MNIQSLKGKLALIALISVTALLISSLTGIVSTKTELGNIHEIGRVRMPSVNGLQMISSGIGIVKAQQLSVALYENEDISSSKVRQDFEHLLKKQRAGLDQIDKGWKIYESLPQTREEAAMWTQFVNEYAAWKAQAAKIAVVMEAMGKGLEQEHKALFDSYFKEYQTIRPLERLASSSVDKVLNLNVKIGDETAVDAEKSASMFVSTLYAVALAALLALVAAIYWVTRAVMKQLGGEPALATEIANKIAKGDMSTTITVAAEDSTSLLSAMKRMTAAIQAMSVDATLLAKAAVDGKLSTRADASRHQGDFQHIVKGVNDTLDAVITPLNVAASYVDRIAKGDIPAKITDSYNGDFNTIKNNLNTCIEAINALVLDANRLSTATLQGQLATRADASQHQGDYRKVVNGLNEVMLAVSTPVQELTEVLGAMKSGDLTRSMKQPYQGTWDELKSAVNDMISKLSQVVNDVNNGAQSLASASEEVSATSQSLSQAASEQASGVEETSASLEQMTSSIAQNTENAKITERRSASLTTLRRRPTCWPSMQRLKPPVPATTAKALRWWPPRCANWLNAARWQHRKSARWPVTVWRWPRKPDGCWPKLCPTSARPATWCKRSRSPPASNPAASGKSTRR